MIRLLEAARKGAGPVLIGLGISAALAGCATTPPDAACEPRAAHEPQCVVPAPRRLGPLKEGEPVHVVVDARCPWNRTGIRMEKGAAYAVTATVRVEHGWVDKTVKSDLARGWDDGPLSRLLGSILGLGARAPALPLYSLVAAQGETTGVYTLAGHGARIETKGEQEAELLFFANDWSGMYGNNHGCADATVRRVK